MKRCFRILSALALGLAPAPGPALADPGQGLTTLQIQSPGEGHTARKLLLPLDKAAIVELPVEARDVLVSNPDIADAVMRSAKRVYLLGLKVGNTNVFFFDAAGRQILSLEIRVERDVAPLDDMIKKLAPDARVRLEALNDNLVLSGTVMNAVQASQIVSLAARFVGKEENVVNMLNVAAKDQVVLKVRVVEMQRSLIKQLGVNLSGLGNIDGVVATNVESLTSFALQGQSLGGLTLGLEMNRESSQGPTSSTDATIKAFERVGLIRTLAEPNLVAVSGESAKFLAGGEFPVPVAQDDEGRITVSFKPYGVGLGFTPIVLSEGRISLRISTEVSELTNQGAFQTSTVPIQDGNGNVIGYSQGLTIPALKVRRAETTMELPSGGSMMMAGLIQQQQRQVIDKVPGIADLPVLGSLFRSRDFQAEETELVVLITPYLVDPTGRSQLKTPDETLRIASDRTGALMGRLNEVYRAPGAQVGSETLKGPVGHVVD